MNRPARIRTVMLFPLFLPTLMGCSGPPQWAGSVAIQDGVEVISNPGVPLLPDSRGAVSKLWTVEGTDWVNPTRVHGHGGLVYVVDPQANQLHLVSSSGGMEASLGRPGGGPGEFLDLLDAFRVGDSIVVLDRGKGSVQYLDLEGNYLSSLHIDGQAWSGFYLGSGELLVKGEFLSDPTQDTRGDWVRMEEGREPVAFTDVGLAPLPEEQGVQCSDLSAWWDGAARLRFTTPQIQLFDEAGRLTMESRIDLPVEVITEAEREAALDVLRDQLSARGMPPPFIEQSLVVNEERWRVKCRFGPLRFDPSGRLAAFLEQNPDSFGSGNATLHFLSREGIYLASIAFPTPWRDFAMDDGVVYALIRNPVTDIVDLEAFRVELPPTLFSHAVRVLEEARQG